MEKEATNAKTKVKSFFGNLKDYFLNAKNDTKNQKMIIKIVSACLTLLIVIIAYFSISFAFFKPASMFDSSPIEIQVNRGATLSQISKELENKGLIRNSSVFKLYADFSDYSSKIRSGTYQLNKTMTMQDIARELTKGGVSDSEVSVTITEGMTIEDIAARLYDTGVISSEEKFLKSCDKIENYLDYTFISEMKTDGKRYAIEGYLFPDTYRFFTGSSDEEVIEKMLSRFNQVFTPEWVEKAEKMNMSVDEVVILASMIEKEAKTSDFTKVSAVFHNRLKSDMKLESCATIQYAMRMKRLALTDEDTSYDSPYNTYQRSGLPSGAVCNPGTASLQAALNPDNDYTKEKYLYFCSRDPESGELAFSKTYSEHQNNVNEYRDLWVAYDNSLK